MSFFNLDPAILALVAGTVFFVLLGILIMFVREVNRKVIFGIVFILIGLTLALFAAGEPGLAVIVVAVILAPVADEILDRLGIVD